MPSQPWREPPASVKAVVIVQAALTGLLCVGILYLVVLLTLTEWDRDGYTSFDEFLAIGLAVFFLIIFIITAVALGITIPLWVFLWRGSQTARIIYTVLLGLGVLSNLLTLFSGISDYSSNSSALTGFVVSLAINGIYIACLYTPAANAHFRPQPVVPMAPMAWAPPR